VSSIRASSISVSGSMGALELRRGVLERVKYQSIRASFGASVLRSIEPQSLGASERRVVGKHQTVSECVGSVGVSSLGASQY
jgi:hypothetical protein